MQIAGNLADALSIRTLRQPFKPTNNKGQGLKRASRGLLNKLSNMSNTLVVEKGVGHMRSGRWMQTQVKSVVNFIFL